MSKNKDFTHCVELLSKAGKADKLAKKGDKDERLKALVLYREAVELLPAMIEHKSVKPAVKVALTKKLEGAQKRLGEVSSGCALRMALLRVFPLQLTGLAVARQSNACPLARSSRVDCPTR